MGMFQGLKLRQDLLGQGISNAVGFALAERQMNARFGDQIVESSYLRYSWRRLSYGRDLPGSNFIGWASKIK